MIGESGAVVVEGERGSAEEQRLALRGALLEVNSEIRRVAARLHGVTEADAVWEFMCECGARGCFSPVTLTLMEFDAIRSAGERILAEGHTVDRAEDARRVAAELADASALKAQAEQQVQRAKNNLRQRDDD